MRPYPGYCSGEKESARRATRQIVTGELGRQQGPRTCPRCDARTTKLTCRCGYRRLPLNAPYSLRDRYQFAAHLRAGHYAAAMSIVRRRETA